MQQLLTHNKKHRAESAKLKRHNTRLKEFIRAEAAQYGRALNKGL